MFRLHSCGLRSPLGPSAPREKTRSGSPHRSHPHVLLSLLLLPLAAQPTGAQEKVGEVLEQLQKSYESVRTIQAEFEQVYRSRRFDEKKAKGNLTIAKPGKMRWDYDEPKGKVLVSDGKKMTLFDPEDRQAMVSEQPP